MYSAGQRICDEIMSLCLEQVKSCKTAFDVIANEPLVTEETIKSLMALVIHHPFLWDVKSRLFPDVKTLLSNKM